VAEVGRIGTYVVYATFLDGEWVDAGDGFEKFVPREEEEHVIILDARDIREANEKVKAYSVLLGYADAFIEKIETLGGEVVWRNPETL
jgi:hypothetical protein